jgi:argininosuccinate lyase
VLREVHPKERLHHLGMTGGIICGLHIQKGNVERAVQKLSMMSQVLEHKQVVKGTPFRQKATLAGEDVSKLGASLTVGQVHLRAQAVGI